MDCTPTNTSVRIPVYANTRDCFRCPDGWVEAETSEKNDMNLKGSKVTSFVARSSHDRCAQHLRRTRGCDAHPAWIWRICNVRRESGAYVTQMLGANLRTVCVMQPAYHANVARTCHARSAQQWMLLLNPSVIATFPFPSWIPNLHVFRGVRSRNRL
jgi:hypothetical protein